MANTLNGVNLAVIAQTTLDALLSETPFLTGFTTDLSAEVAEKGASITTRVPSAVTAVDIAANGYAPTDVTSTAVTVNLSNHQGFGWGFTDLEVSQGGMGLLSRVFIQPAVQAISKKVATDVLALATNANFGAASFTGAASTFDSADVADLAQILTTANVARSGRTLLLLPTYFAALAKDSAVKAAYAYGSTSVVADNIIPKLHGFAVHEYSDLPANGENLVGIATGKQALVLATRVPEIPQNFPGQVVNATDPASGLTIQLRQWVAPDQVKQNRMAASIIYGVAKGTGSLKRMVSA